MCGGCQVGGSLSRRSGTGGSREVGLVGAGVVGGIGMNPARSVHRCIHKAREDARSLSMDWCNSLGMQSYHEATHRDPEGKRSILYHSMLGVKHTLIWNNKNTEVQTGTGSSDLHPSDP